MSALFDRNSRLIIHAHAIARTLAMCFFLDRWTMTHDRLDTFIDSHHIWQSYYIAIPRFWRALNRDLTVVHLSQVAA